MKQFWLALALVFALNSFAFAQERKAEPVKALLVIDATELSWGIRDAALSPDGKRIVTGHYSGYWSHSHADVWDATTGKRLLNIKTHENGSCLAVAYSSDGKRIASGGTDNLVRVWDAETGKHLLTLKGHSGYLVWSVAFSPDGKRIISGGGGKDRVRVWDAETGKEVTELEANTTGVRRVAYSPDGKQIARSGTDDTVKVWDAQTGKEVLTVKAKNVIGIAFSPDSKRIACACGGDILIRRGVKTDDRTLVKVWDAGRKELVSVELPKKVTLGCVAFSPDGKWIVTGGYDKRETKEGKGQLLSLVKVWDAATGREVATFNPKTTHPYDAEVVAVAFTPDGNRIVAACAGWTVHVLAFDPPTAKE